MLLFLSDRCMQMALIHDMAECIVGDLTPYCGVSPSEKHQREDDAMTLLSKLVPQPQGQNMLNLFKVCLFTLSIFGGLDSLFSLQASLNLRTEYSENFVKLLRRF